MQRYLVLWLLPFAAGCGATATEIPDQFGQRAIPIRCGADPDQCPAKAKNVCPRGYDVTQTGEDRTIVTSGTPGNPQTMVVPEHLMTVKCK